MATDQYMAACTEGDGALTSWLPTFDAANEAGKEHERVTHGHRWIVLSREAPVPDGGPSDATSFLEMVSSRGSAPGATLNAPYAMSMATADPPSCDGNACGVVSEWYDGHYWWRNNSPNRSVRVQISNGVAGCILDLAPGQQKDTMLAWFEGSYHANYL